MKHLLKPVVWLFPIGSAQNPWPVASSRPSSEAAPRGAPKKKPSTAAARVLSARVATDGSGAAEGFVRTLGARNRMHVRRKTYFRVF